MTTETDTAQSTPPEPTPGPWTVSKSFTPGFFGCPAIQADDPADGEMFELCLLFGEDDDSHPTAMTHANAALIAAAPETALMRDRLQEMNAELLAAGKKNVALIQRAQEILTSYLVPEGITASDMAGQMLELLDGPEQRAAKAAWDESSAKAEALA